MTVFKIRNPSHSTHPLHTVDGVRNIGPRRTREFDLSKAGEKLVRASDVLNIVEDAKPKPPKATQKPADAATDSEAPDVHGEGSSAPEDRSDESCSGTEGTI